MKSRVRTWALQVVIYSVVLLVLCGTSVWAQAPQIVSTAPSQYELHVASGSSVEVTFDQDMDPATITDTSFVVVGFVSGFLSGSLSYDGPSRTATFTPDDVFRAGAVITVILTAAVEAANGTPLDPFSWTFTAACVGGTGRFKPAQAVVTDSTPTMAVVADFDRDGILDIANTNLWSQSTSLLFGDGSGGFASPVNYPGSFGPHGLSAVDMDRDGDMDLVVCSSWDDLVLIYSNDGAGTFVQDTVFVAGDFPWLPVTVDLNGDAMPDLAAGNGSRVSVFLNNGDGSLGSETQYPTTNGRGTPVAVDIDLDGDFDLITSSDYRMGILRNNGDGTFASPDTLHSVDQPWQVTAGDIDADGDPDVVATQDKNDPDSDPDTVTVLTNDALGSLSIASQFTVGDGPEGGSFLSDLDADGDLDMVTAVTYGGYIELHFNDGTGTFSSGGTIDIGYATAYITTVDLDGDGDMDLLHPNISDLAAQYDSKTISVLYNITCVDSDGDDYGDSGHVENECETDNCPEAFNPDQMDSDGDGIGNSCDCNILVLPVLGDVDQSESVTSADIIYLVNYVFKGDDAPLPCTAAGDVNCDGNVTSADIIYLVNFVFKGGPGPCDVCALIDEGTSMCP